MVESALLERALSNRTSTTTLWTPSDLLRGATVTYSRGILPFTLTACEGTARVRSWKACFRVELRLVSTAKAHQMGDGERTFVCLMRKYGVWIKVKAKSGAAEIKVVQDRLFRPWAFEPANNAPFFTTSYAFPLTFHEAADRQSFPVSVTIKYRLDCTMKDYLAALLPLYFNKTSPLPSPFLPHATIVQSLTTEPFDVVFLFPTSDADGVSQRIYGHGKKYLAACPALAPLFADGVAESDEGMETDGNASTGEAESSGAEGGNGNERPKPLEDGARAAAASAAGEEDKSLAEDGAGARIPAKARADTKDSRGQRSPAPSRSPSPLPKKPRLSQQPSPPASDSGRQSRNPSPTPLPSPSPASEIQQDLLNVPVEILSYGQFLALHQYVYSVDRNVLEWDIDEFTFTYLSDTPLGKAIDEKMRAQLKEDPTAAVLTTDTRDLPHYRAAAFNSFRQLDTHSRDSKYKELRATAANAEDWMKLILFDLHNW
ncbi:hypothetical protein JCM10207_007803 [Rhodosporidiobolus poonsookiae]